MYDWGDLLLSFIQEHRAAESQSEEKIPLFMRSFILFILSSWKPKLYFSLFSV